MSAAASSMYIQNGSSCWRRMDVQSLIKDKALPWKRTSKCTRNIPSFHTKAKSDPGLKQILQHTPHLRENMLPLTLLEPAVCPGSPHRLLQPPDISP